jgi:hypothetical protein
MKWRSDPEARESHRSRVAAMKKAPGCPLLEIARDVIGRSTQATILCHSVGSTAYGQPLQPPNSAVMSKPVQPQTLSVRDRPVVVATGEFHENARLIAHGPRIVTRWQQHDIVL